MSDDWLDFNIRVKDVENGMNINIESNEDGMDKCTIDVNVLNKGKNEDLPNFNVKLSKGCKSTVEDKIGDIAISLLEGEASTENILGSVLGLLGDKDE